MELNISAYNLNKLLQDVYSNGWGWTTIMIRYTGYNKEEGCDYYRVKLKRYQVQDLKKTIPHKEILERYESR